MTQFWNVCADRVSATHNILGLGRGRESRILIGSQVSFLYETCQVICIILWMLRLQFLLFLKACFVVFQHSRFWHPFIPPTCIQARQSTLLRPNKVDIQFLRLLDLNTHAECGFLILLYIIGMTCTTTPSDRLCDTHKSQPRSKLFALNAHFGRVQINISVIHV